MSTHHLDQPAPDILAWIREAEADGTARPVLANIDALDPRVCDEPARAL